VKRIVRYTPQWAVLILCTGISAPYVFATAGAIIRRADRITIATDTLGISGADNPHPEPIHHCKIHITNKTLFYFGGFTGDNKTNFHPLEIANSVLNTSGTIESRTRKLAEAIRGPLLIAVQRINRDVPEPIKSKSIGHAGETPTQLAVFGIENKIPIVVTVNFQRIDFGDTNPVGIYAEIKVCPGDGCAIPDASWFLLGQQEESKAVIDKGNFWSGNDGDDVRRIVEIEIKANPDSVGGPIDVLTLESDGTYKWIAPLGICKCSKSHKNQK
jgi:hypothetical protein